MRVCIVLIVVVAIAGCSFPCTQESCPLNQLCAGDGRCVSPPPPHEGGEGEGEGEGASGEGEGEGEGTANASCGDDHFGGSYDDVFVLGSVSGSASTEALASVANASDYGATFDQLTTRPTIALDGTIVVHEGTGASLGYYRYVAEAHVASGPNPSDCNFDATNDFADDVQLPTTLCDPSSNTPVFKLLLQGGSSTDYAYQCLNDPNFYDGATNTPVFNVNGTNVPRAYAADGTLFVDQDQIGALVHHAGGNEAPVALGNEPFTIYVVRESGGSFLAAVEDKTGANATLNAPYNLFSVSTLGDATQLGTYQGFTGDHVFLAAMDGSGNLFLPDINGVVTQYSISVAPVVVYDPATSPVDGVVTLFSGGTVAGF
jgi:hypothetical protein